MTVRRTHDVADGIARLGSETAFPSPVLGLATILSRTLRRE